MASKTPGVFIRYKLYHIPFWILYHYIWWAVNMGSLTAPLFNIVGTPYSVKFFFYVIFQAIGVYFNLYYLIPRFFSRKTVPLYIILASGAVLLSALLVTTGYYVSAFLSQQSFEDLFGRPGSEFWYFFKNQALPSTAAAMTLAMSVKLGKNWFEMQKKQQVLEKEKLETELKYLRSQLNPHFLFNTINSIFVLIKKDPTSASDALASFSDLMRYQLYECNGNKVPLITEIEHMQKFIQLQQLRYTTNLQVDLRTPSIIHPRIQITPFILTTLVENAFKHVSPDQHGRSWIDVNIDLCESNLYVTCSNSCSHQEVSTEKQGGIGLKNIQRRLELLYKEKHQFEIRKEPTNFVVNIRMTLDSMDRVASSNLATTWN